MMIPLSRITIKELLLWFLVGLIVTLTLVGFFSIRSARQLRIEEDFRGDAARLVDLLEHEFVHQANYLKTVRAFFYASQEVRPDEFSSFVTQFLADEPDVLAISWLPHIPLAEQAAFEQSVRAGGIPDFYIYEFDPDNNKIPVAERAEYYPVAVSEPAAKNHTLLGFDYYSSPARRQTIDLARDSGETTVSSPLQLLQDAGAGIGLLIMMPVYQNNIAAGTTANRRGNLQGLVVETVHPAEFVHHALVTIVPHDIELYLYDVTDPEAPAEFLAFYPSLSGDQTLPAAGPPLPDILQTGLFQTAVIQVGGRNWLIISRAGATYGAETFGWGGWGVLLGGLLLTVAVLSYVKIRRNTEVALARSEAEFRAMSDNALTGVMRSDMAGNIIYANDAMAHIFELESKEALIGRPLAALASDQEQFDAAAQRLLAEGQIRDHEIEIVSATGKKHWLLFSAALQDGVVTGTLVDITDRIQTEEELRQLSSVMSQMADTVVITDVDGVIEYVNPAFERSTGYSLADVVGQTPRVLKSDKHSPDFYERLWQTILAGEIFQDELINRKKDGTLIHEVKTITPILNAAGGIAHFVATGKDITERKAAENAVGLIEKRNSALIQNAPDGIVLLGIDGKITFASPSALQLFGYTTAEIAGVDPVEKIHPDDIPHIMQVIDRTLNNPDEVFSAQYRFRHQNGTYRWIEGTYSNLIADPAVHGVVINFRDITEQRQMETAVRERVKELTCLFAVSRLLQDNSAGEETLCRQIVELLVPAMQFPDLTVPVIEIGEQRYSLDGHNNPPASHTQLTSDICINAQNVGRLSVFYTEEKPFIFPEEQELLDNIARMLGLWLERKQAATELRASTERFQQLAENIHEVFWMYDMAEAKLVYISPAYEMIWGRPCQALYENAREYINGIMPEDQPAMLAALEKQDRGEYTDMEYRVLRPDGTIRWVWDRSFPIFDAAGNLARTAGVATDVTDEKLALQNLEALNRELEQRVEERTADLRESRDQLSAVNAALAKASRLKDEFLASMSHELRTPLTSILGLTEVLQMQTFGEMDERQLQAISHIEDSGQHLLDLINDILDLSKIEAGKLELDIESCSVADICQASLQLTKGMAHQKQQTIGFGMTPLSITVQADPRYLKQMVVNLLSNAIKFTPAGGQLGLTVEGCETDHLVYLTVWDEGIGMQPEDIAQLFKPFTQLDSSLSRQQAGTGLGLSLVRLMAELHGGSIKVESEPDRGSRFTIVLPWSHNGAHPENNLNGTAPGQNELSAELPASATTTASAAGEPEPLSAPQVLMADDNEIILQTISGYLSARGYHVTNVRSGFEVLERVAEINPEIILMDIQMPGMDGLETIRRLRAHADPVVAHIPVIAVTALAMPGDREKCLQAGANEYLSKPVSLAQLVNRIKLLLPGVMHPAVKKPAP